MTSRAFLIVLASVSGTPMLAAGLMVCCPSTTAAVIACLALAAGGMLGACVGAAQISAALPAGKAEIAPETSDAIRDAVERLNARRNHA